MLTVFHSVINSYRFGSVGKWVPTQNSISFGALKIILHVSNIT